MRFEHLPAMHRFLAHNCGTGLARGVRCEHGDTAFDLDLHGAWETVQDEEQRLPVAMGRCVAAHVFGGLLATLTATEGEHASDRFLQDVLAARQATTAELHRLNAEGRLCCQAAFTTGSREHTCGRNTTPGTTS